MTNQTPAVTPESTAEAGALYLGRYVPRIAVGWDDESPGLQWQELDGTLCFVDISGFTSLSERLAKRGRIGAETLTEILDRSFSAMLRTASSYGGSLIKFGGDALLLLFSGEDHAVRATSAVVAMQSTLRATSGEPTEAGRVRLRMSAGVHSGLIHLFCVGTSHRELMITGPAGTITTRMEQAAEAGEIIISSATRALLPGSAAPVAKGPGWRLKWRKPVSEPSHFAGRADLTTADVTRWVPATLRSFLSAAKPEPEHRVATVGFVRFCGVDERIAREGPATVTLGLQAMTDIIQESVDVEGVTFLATDINEDGGKVLLVAGAPAAQEDDDGRLLRAMRRIADAETPFDLHIGVNRGHVFAGEIGTEYRSTYTVMGDTVNVAARLCAAAWAGHILVTPDVLERSHTAYATSRLEPLRVKGKTDAIDVYSLGEEIGFRPEATRTDLPFVGRGSELAAVTAALTRGAAGDGAVVTITGDSGVGKSRLVEEAMRQFDDIRSIELRAEPYGAASPYRPFRDPIRHLLGIARDTQPAMAQTLRTGVEALDASLLPLLPLLGDVAHIEVAATPETDAIDPRFRRDRLADMITQILSEVLDGDTVFLVEDAQWMDEASADLLARIAAETQHRRWSMLVTRRPGAEGFVPHPSVRVDLEPLTEEESEELIVAATAAAPLPPHEVDAISHRAEGNPLFIEETIKIVREAGGSEALPDSLSAVMGARIDALPPLARLILRYASVLGRSFRIDALREILEAEDIRLDAATRGELRGFLESDGKSRLRFRHALARDVAYEGLAYRRRRQLHLRIAESAERQAGEHAEEVADLLATHYSLAGSHGAAFRYARIAGDSARDAFANVESAANYERALDAARRLGDVPDAERAGVWIDLGDVRVPIGRFDDALDAYRRASRLLTGDPVAVADVYYKRALMRERSGAYSQALREVTRGMRLIEGVATAEADRIRARLAVRRAFVRQAQERSRDAMTLALAAIDEAAEAGERLAEGHACMIVHWARLVLGLPNGAEYGERALRIFESTDDLESLSAVTNLLGADAYFAGRWDEAVAYYAQGKAAAERSGNVVHAAFFESNIGEVLVDQRRFDEAEPILRRAARVQRGSGWTEGADLAELYLGRLLSERGDAEEALEILRRVQSDHLESGRSASAAEATIYIAECLVRSGRADEAAATLAQIESAASDFVMHTATLARVRSEILTAQGRVNDALIEARRAVTFATEQNMDYERALATLTVVALEGLAGEADSDPMRVEALAVLERLGVHIGSASAT